MKFRVSAWVFGDFEQRLEHICKRNQVWDQLVLPPGIRELTDNDILKGIDKSALLVHIIQPGYLNEPSYIVGVQFVVDDPFCQVVPFAGRSPVYADTPFTILAHVKI